MFSEKLLSATSAFAQSMSDSPVYIAQVQLNATFFFVSVLFIIFACVIAVVGYWKARNAEKKMLDELQKLRAGLDRLDQTQRDFKDYILNTEFIETLKTRGLFLNERDLDSFWSSLNNLLLRQPEVVASIKTLGRFMSKEEVEQFRNEIANYATKQDLDSLRKALEGFATRKQLEKISKEQNKHREALDANMDTLLKLYVEETPDPQMVLEALKKEKH